MSQSVNFKIEVTMEERWVPQFLSFLNYMELLGRIGSSETVAFFSDGDGDFHPKFGWDADIKAAPVPSNLHWDAG